MFFSSPLAPCAVTGWEAAPVLPTPIFPCILITHSCNCRLGCLSPPLLCTCTSQRRQVARSVPFLPSQSQQPEREARLGKQRYPVPVCSIYPVKINKSTFTFIQHLIDIHEIVKTLHLFTSHTTALWGRSVSFPSTCQRLEGLVQTMWSPLCSEICSPSHPGRCLMHSVMLTDRWTDSLEQRRPQDTARQSSGLVEPGYFWLALDRGSILRMVL